MFAAVAELDAAVVVENEDVPVTESVPLRESEGTLREPTFNV